MMKTRLVVLVSILIVAVVCGQPASAAGKTYYVSTSGDDSADGLAEKTAWRTITHAATQAQAGDTVYIKGGNYGDERVVIKNSGASGHPIVFRGYKDRPGDNANPNELPLLRGSDRKGCGIVVYGAYIRIDGICVANYHSGIVGQGIVGEGKGLHHITLSNITAYYNLGNGIVISRGHDVVINNCTAYNNDMCNFALSHTKNSLIENCRSFSYEVVPGMTPKESHGKTFYSYADYYYALGNGSTNNTIKNCTAGGYPESKYHWSGHGYAFRNGASHNKVINCRSYNTGCEHYKVSEDSDYNEFVNCIAAGAHSAKVSWDGKKWIKSNPGNMVGFHIKSSHSKIINCTVRDVGRGISLYWCIRGAETSCRPLTGNLLKNNILTNNRIGISFCKDTAKNIIEYNNVWGNKVNYQNCSAGRGDISEDPRFVNPAAYDFHLKSRYGRWDGKKWVKDKATSPCIDAGDPKSKWKNESAPNGGRVNIGAYGNTPEASKSAGATPARKGR